MKISNFNSPTGKQILHGKNAALLILSGIIILAAVLRLWQLGSVPPAGDWDEVALGYDAYSFIQTGRDEFGVFLPVVLRSYDDYKPALYAYLAVPPVKLFGLSLFATRLPSAVFGIFAVLGTFLLVRELFKRDALALLSAFLFAISPWSIQFSRVAFEANVAGTLNIFSALFFLKSLKKSRFLFLSVLFAALSIYTYQSEKVFVPLFISGLVIIFRKAFLQLPKKTLIGSFVFGVVLVLPMLLYIATNHNALMRVKGTSVFNNSTLFLQTTAQRFSSDYVHHDRIGELFDNRRITYGRAIIEGYLSHFSLNWLFMNGDISRHHAPDMGILYLGELPFVMIGIYMLLFSSYNKKTKAVILFWFFLAPLPASITTGVPHAVRTLNFLPMFQVFTALGISVAVKKVYSIKYTVSTIPVKHIMICFAFVIVLFNFLYYLDQYFIQLNYFDSEDWNYGYGQLVPQVQKVMGQYKKIVVSDNRPLDRSYMYFLFYLRYPPALYQAAYRNDTGKFTTHHTFSKFEFKPLQWETDLHDRDILFIGNPDELPHSYTPLKMFYYLDGKPAVMMIET